MPHQNNNLLIPGIGRRDEKSNQFSCVIDVKISRILDCIIRVRILLCEASYLATIWYRLSSSDTTNKNLHLHHIRNL